MMQESEHPSPETPEVRQTTPASDSDSNSDQGIEIITSHPTPPPPDEGLTDHVTSVLDGKQQLEEAKQAVSDLSVICRALRVILVMQGSLLLQCLRNKAVTYTNNDQLRPLRVIVKKHYGLISKHYSAHLKPRLKTHGKVLWGSAMVLAAWALFFLLYYRLFNFDFLERSFEGVDDPDPVFGPFFKRHLSLKEKKSLTDLAMRKHRFNSFLSDQIALNRDIPDTRSEG